MSKNIHQWLNYRVTDPLWGLIDHVTFSLLRCLSLQRASDLGAWLGRMARNRFKQANVDAMANLQLLRPELSCDECQAMADRMWQNIGRTLTEMAQLDRFDLSEHVPIQEIQVLDALDKSAPIIFLFPHLGNWELLALTVVQKGHRLNVIYEAVPNRFQRRLLERLRKRAGYDLVSPDYSGTRRIFRALAAGESIGVAMDEFKHGRIVSPAFGRPLPENSNIRYAIGLARRFNAPIVTAHCKRAGALGFEIKFDEPVRLDAQEYRDYGDDGIARILNDRCEGLVTANLEQWYMLHRARITRG